MKYPNLLDETFISLTTFGNPIFYILVLLVLVAFDASLALPLFLALIFVELSCILIKLMYRKDRPVPQSREGIFNRVDANSFPSVHSTRIALLATMIILYYQNFLLSLVGIVVMFLVGYSRVYLQRHYVKDVIFGFLLGIITAIIITNLSL